MEEGQQVGENGQGQGQGAQSRLRRCERNDGDLPGAVAPASEKRQPRGCPILNHLASSNPLLSFQEMVDDHFLHEAPLARNPSSPALPP
ncbi:MAG: hypothetical protein ACOZCP_02265, partial [Pseudomonadota bacterium]